MGNRFAARLEEFWKVHDQLEDTGICILCGTGGLGKTQLATEYARRLGYRYPGGVFQIPADQGREAIVQTITNAIKLESERKGDASIKITLDERLPIEDRLTDLWRALSKRERMLIILDNFEDDILQEYLPPPGRIFAVIVTSRRVHYPQHESLALDALRRERGVELLNTGKRKFGEEAYALIDTLGGLPLALELARNQLNRYGYKSPDDFVTEIRDHGAIASLQKFAKHYLAELPTQHEKDVAATIALSYDQTREPARHCLNALALFAEAPVPRQLILRALANKHDADTIEAALVELQQKHALMELDEHQEPTLHRLVRAYVRDRLSGEEQDRLTPLVGRAILDEMQRVTDAADTKTYRELEPVLAHAEEYIDGSELGLASYRKRRTIPRQHSQKTRINLAVPPTNTGTNRLPSTTDHGIIRHELPHGHDPRGD